jgi:hypothetical protein
MAKSSALKDRFTFNSIRLGKQFRLATTLNWELVCVSSNTEHRTPKTEHLKPPRSGDELFPGMQSAFCTHLASLTEALSFGSTGPLSHRPTSLVAKSKPYSLLCFFN